MGKLIAIGPHAEVIYANYPYQWGQVCAAAGRVDAQGKPRYILHQLRQVGVRSTVVGRVNLKKSRSSDTLRYLEAEGSVLSIRFYCSVGALAASQPRAATAKPWPRLSKRPARHGIASSAQCLHSWPRVARASPNQLPHLLAKIPLDVSRIRHILSTIQ